MPSEINLLAQRKVGFFSEERVLLGTKIFAVICIILVVSLSILFFFLSRDPAAVQMQADQSRTITQLTILQSKTAKYLIIVDRVNKIKLLSKKRKNFDATIGSLMQQIPPSVNVTNLTLDQNAITLSVSASDLSLLGKTINNFTTLIQNKKVLKSLTVEGLVSDEKGGTYVLSISGGLL